MLDEGNCFTVIDDASGLDDKLLRVEFELMESSRTDAFQHFHNGTASKTRSLYQLAHKVIRYLCTNGFRHTDSLHRGCVHSSSGF